MWGHSVGCLISILGGLLTSRSTAPPQIAIDVSPPQVMVLEFTSSGWGSRQRGAGGPQARSFRPIATMPAGQFMKVLTAQVRFQL